MKFRSFVNRLYSVRTSACLMGAALAIFLMGQIVPQKKLLTIQDMTTWRMEHPSLYKGLEALGMLEIYTSPLAIAVLGLFFLNLFLVFQARFGAVWRKCALDLSFPPDVNSSLVIDITGWERTEVFEQLRSLLKRQKFLAEGERFLSVRNRFGPLGSVVFHLSFLILLAGGLMLYYTRSIGTAFVAEGQYFSGTRGEFQTLRPALIGDTPQLPFRLLDITPQYFQGSPIDLEARIELQDADSQRQAEQIRVNHPLMYGDTSMLIRRIDIAPVIKMEDISGKRIFEYAAVKLHVLEDKVDSYRVPFTSYGIDFEFYPDYVVEDGLEMSRSVELNNPVFRVRVTDDGRELFSGPMRPGEPREFARLRFTIEDILFWGDFLLVKERGGTLLWVGFILGIVGLCWRFFFFRTEVRGEFRGDTLLLSFRSEQSWAFGARWVEDHRVRMKRAFSREEC